MKVIVIGLGVQGHKRKHFAAEDFVASVDPVNRDAEYLDVTEVPLSAYDAALVCVPDDEKLELLSYLVRHGKHILVEKPLWIQDAARFEALESAAISNGVVCYTAYNHRFEPHFQSMRNLIVSGELGEIYRCRMFYGNGTAQLVRDSEWRDKGAGVLPDLGSHLLDTASFWFGDLGDDFRVVSASRHENAAPDHVVIASDTTKPKLELEMTLLMWRNHFTCDVLAENGSAHIESLCKWGPSTFTHRKRVRPSGRPPEESVTLVCDDPTWALEYDHFRELCTRAARTDFARDRWLNRMLGRLGASAMEMAGK
ncbi:MAG: Gfo/Idh/MocA family oxidoreductase [Alphaproteobacteria bacterium]